MSVESFPNILSLNIKIPERVKFPSRLNYLNSLFGPEGREGLLIGGTYFITGDYNAGKTSLALDMADDLKSDGHHPIYDSSEMIISEIEMQRRRMNLLNGFSIRSSDGNGEDTNPTSINDIIMGDEEPLISRDQELLIEFYNRSQQLEKERNGPEDNRRVIMFIDSLQSLVPGRGAQAAFVKRAIKVTQLCKGITFIIGQVNKTGAFAGNNSIGHDITAHVHMKVLTNDGKDQARLLFIKKNRAGPSGSIITNLTSTGHVPDSEPSTNNQELHSDDGEENQN